MNRSSLRHLLRATALGLILVLAASSLGVVGATLPSSKFLVIEPATTWAGLARVHLKIEDLQVNGAVLEGSYQIRVPLSPRENDTGRVILHSSLSIEELGRNSATVTGSAVSSTGRVHEVVAQMQPNGVVRIHVTTPERNLRFKSRYMSR